MTKQPEHSTDQELDNKNLDSSNKKETVEEIMTDLDEQHGFAADANDNEVITDLELQLNEQRKLAEEQTQKLLRAQADFDNFRRRARLEKEDFAKYASSKLIEQLLPVVDNFERALDASRDTKDFEALIKGIDMIFRQFDQVLTEEGLTRMNAVGQPFNPEYHQAIMQVESEEYEEGIVMEEIQKGYVLKDKVLRPAMVKVSQ